MNDKEYSFEEFFASGTGIESEKTETSSLSSEDFDGYVDGISMEIYQTNEDIEFLNSFEAVYHKNIQDKIIMLKKLKTNYNFKNIESYCDKQIQSSEELNQRFINDCEIVKERLNNSKESLEQKDVKKIKFDISYSQNKKYENHKLINVISKIEKEKNIWIPEQLQIFYFKYNDNNFGSIDINKLPDLDHYKSFDCLSDVLMDTSKLKPETLKFLIPFIAMGNGDYVCVYKDDSIIYYSHDGKTTFEKLDYKDLNEFCNSFISDKDWKKLEKKGISMDKEFFK